tara:strand:+ start:1117 stop:1230 length:114 start_codon:yes stop_codon:yes gene_type:complete
MVFSPFGVPPSLLDKQAPSVYEVEALDLSRKIHAFLG